MADKNQKIAVDGLRYSGVITRSDITSAEIKGWDSVSVIDNGRADIGCLWRGKSFHVEVKYAKMSFGFSNWRKNQRWFAEITTRDPYCVPYWMFLTMGSDPASYSPEKYSPKKSWLFPHWKMLQIEAVLSPYQVSLPYRVKSGMNKIIQRQKLDAIHLLENYELSWAPHDSLIKPKELCVKWDKVKQEIIEPVGEIRYGGFWIIPDNHPIWRSWE